MKGEPSMTKRLVLVAGFLLLFGSLAWAADRTWIVRVGTVSDSHCGKAHATASDKAASCVLKCVANGHKYVLIFRDKVYQLDAQDKFKDYAGKRVKVYTLQDTSGPKATAQLWSPRLDPSKKNNQT
jgi:hypothetical protein